MVFLRWLFWSSRKTSPGLRVVNLIMFHMISFLVCSKGLPRETCDLVFHVPYLLLESQRFVGMSVSAKRSFRVTLLTVIPTNVQSIRRSSEAFV